ncbi:unnamed protein product [Polarella glacialis]|uniref:Uncharacterized protein n=1 Tax=Polarella glacialis TaxID=89957 RepID=A0A813JBY8_POLGL|nr:unnamed protein product [Polarella glacialis]
MAAGRQCFRAQPRHLCAVLVLSLLVRPSSAGVSCSNFEPFVKWVKTWESTCKPQDANATNFSWFASCSWVQCDCLWVGLSAPVPNDELAPCLSQANLLGSLEQDQKWFLTAMMRTCKGRTDELSLPCGQCDKFRDYRQGARTADVAGVSCATSQFERRSTG